MILYCVSVFFACLMLYAEEGQCVQDLFEFSLPRFRFFKASMRDEAASVPAKAASVCTIGPSLRTTSLSNSFHIRSNTTSASQALLELKAVQFLRGP